MKILFDKTNENKKPMLKVEGTEIVPRTNKKGKEFYVLTLKGKIEVADNLVQTISVTSTANHGPLFVLKLVRDDEDFYVASPSGILHGLMSRLGISDTDEFIGKRLPLTNNRGYFDVDFDAVK